MVLNKKNILKLIVPEYAIMIFTFVAIFLVIQKNIKSIELTIIPSLIYILFLFGFNVLNQVLDAKLDSISKPLRPIPTKKVTINEGLLLASILFVVAFVFGLYTQSLILPIIIFGITIFFYSYPQIFLRRYFFSTPLFGAIFYAIIPFIFMTFYFNKPINYIFLGLFSLIVASVSITKDIEDIDADIKFKINSIPTIIGKRQTILLTLTGLIVTNIIFEFVLIPKSSLFLIPFFVCTILTIFVGNQILKKPDLKKPTTQSKTVSLFMLVTIITELAYALTFFI